MSDTSQATLRYIKEINWGEIPNSGNMTELRFVSESLGIDRSTITSEEIRSDRQISDLIPTKVEASGDINGELSFEAYDDFIEAALCNDWEASIASTVEGVTVSGGKLVYPVAELPPFTLGMGLRLSGFSTQANNRIVVVTGIDTTSREVTVAPALTDETPTGPIQASGTAIVNGVDTKSFLIEKEFTDVSKIIAYFGMVINQMSINVESESVVGLSFSFIGKNGETPATSYKPTGRIPAPVHDVMSSGTQNSTILEGAQEIGLIKSLSLQVANNIRGRTAVGVIGNVDVGKGRFNVTGSISAYFADFRLYAKYLQNQSTSLVFTLTDPMAGSYVFYMPNIKFTESSVVAGGPDQDVMVEGGYQALMDAESGKTLIVTKIE